MRIVKGENYKIYNADCLDVMGEMAAGSVDAIITDPPYGTTACAWDSVIPFAPMWECIKRVIKPRAAVVLFGSQPFTSALVMSNAAWFKYCWYWEKTRATGHLNAKKMPMKNIEDVIVFGESVPRYFPQETTRTMKLQHNSASHVARGVVTDATSVVRGGIKEKPYLQTVTDYPKQTLRFSSEGLTIHPTQKPVALLEYLIKTYTNEGDTVLDFAFGSCSTGIACLNTNRKFIGVEKDSDYFEIGKKRMEEREDYLMQIGSIPLSCDKIGKGKSNYQARSLFEYQQIREMGLYDEQE